MTSHEAQSPGPGSPGGWLPPVPAGQPPPPRGAPPPVAPPWGQQAPWQSTLYYTYREPGNDAGVAGFCFSIAAVIFLVFSFGLAAPLAFPMAIAGTILAVRGRRRVRRGETNQHGGLASAGFWIGLLAILVSVGAAVAWVLAIVNGHALDTNSPVPNRQVPAVIRGR